MTPTAWPEVPLSDVVLDAKPGFASGDDPEVGLFQFRMNNLTRDGGLDLTKRRRVPWDTRNLESYLLRPGDVLFNITNSPELVGKTLYFQALDEPAVFSNHFVRLRTDPTRLDGRFLARWLRFQWGRGVYRVRAKRWVNQATFGRDALLSLRIALPSVDEQRRIVGVLGAADELRVKRRRSLALVNSLTESIFLDMFGDPGANPHRHCVLPLSDVVAEGKAVTYGIVQAGEECPGGVPYIRTGDIVDGQIIAEKLRRTTLEIAAKYERSRVFPGDIVMSIRATVGTTAIVSPELNGANLTQGTARISPGRGICGLYLLSHLRSFGTQRWIQRQVKGATFREITLKRLRELPVMVPSIEQQRDFEHRAVAVARFNKAGVESSRELDELFAALQYRAFRGEM